MTLRDLGELIIWVGSIAAALLGIGAFLQIVVVKPIKRNMNREWTAVKEQTDKLLAEVAPENGVGMSERMKFLEFRIGALETRYSDHLLRNQRHDGRALSDQ